MTVCEDSVCWPFVMILCDHIWWPCGMIVCDDLLWWSCVMPLCADSLWRSCVNMWWHCIMILCDDPVWWLWVIQLCDGRVWWPCVTTSFADSVWWLCVMAVCGGPVWLSHECAGKKKSCKNWEYPTRTVRQMVLWVGWGCLRKNRCLLLDDHWLLWDKSTLPSPVVALFLLIFFLWLAFCSGDFC